MAIGKETLTTVNAPDFRRRVHSEQVPDFFCLTATDEDNTRLTALQDLLDGLAHPRPWNGSIAVDVEGGEGSVVIQSESGSRVPHEPIEERPKLRLGL
jgi:hypothetical protein